MAWALTARSLTLFAPTIFCFACLLCLHICTLTCNCTNHLQKLLRLIDDVFRAVLPLLFAVFVAFDVL